jgi:protein-tyrosine-phosphatase
MPSVLFVCTANICRSPMASALFLALIKEKGEEKNWRVESAGTWAAEGLPAATGSQMALETRGLDARAHRSRRITEDILARFDLILTMEKGQKEALQFEFPDLASRIFLLSEMVNEKFDVDDPIGGPPAEYEETAEKISRILEKGFNKISRLASQSESTEREGY